MAYVVRAVSPGKYVLPQAYVEDMYNPSRYGRTGTGTVEVRRGEMSAPATIKLHRHARACPGHPRLLSRAREDVDGRDQARP